VNRKDRERESEGGKGREKRRESERLMHWLVKRGNALQRDREREREKERKKEKGRKRENERK